MFQFLSDKLFNYFVGASSNRVPAICLTRSLSAEAAEKKAEKVSIQVHFLSVVDVLVYTEQTSDRETEKFIIKFGAIVV